MPDDTAPPHRRQPSAGFRWIAWARSRGLKGSQQAVLTTIATHLDRDGTAFLTYETIATETGVSKATAIRAVKALTASGLIVVAQTSGRVANTYTMSTDELQPTLFGGAPEVPPEKKRGRRKSRGTPAAKGGIPSQKPIAAFYEAQAVNEQVARLVDAGRALGVEMNGGRIAAMLKRGDKATVAERIGVALFKNVAVPEDFAAKNLNGRGSHETTRRADRRKAGTASDDAERLKRGDY
jgi:hypothetical protein